MTRKFSEALSLLWRNLVLFGAIVVTVALPINVAQELAARGGEGDGTFGFLTLSVWLQAIFGPIASGALIFALWQVKTGRPVTWAQAMTVGLRKWGHVFMARLVAGIFAALGLLALIVPGIVLALRYALVDEAVVLEGVSAEQSRSRSSRLMAGRKGRLLGAVILFAIPYALLAGLMGLSAEFYKAQNLLPLQVALTCIVDVVGVVLEIVLFLFYWEAVQAEAAIAVAEPAVASEADPPAGPWDRSREIEP